MGTQTDQKQFLQNLTLGYTGNFCSDNLKIEVQKHREHEPIEYRAKFFHSIAGTWKAYCTSISCYVGDILEDCKQEIKLYESN